MGTLGLGEEGERCEAVWQPVISDFLNNAFCGTHKVSGNGNGDQLRTPHTSNKSAHRRSQGYGISMIRALIEKDSPRPIPKLHC